MTTAAQTVHIGRAFRYWGSACPGEGNAPGVVVLRMHAEQLEQVIAELYVASLTRLPPDVAHALARAVETERHPRGRRVLGVIVENVERAAQRGTVVCQDTGIPEFRIAVGGLARLEGDLAQPLRRAVESVTRDFPLVPHCANPLSRQNTGTNTGYRVPVVRWDFLAGADYVEVTSCPVPGVCVGSSLRHVDDRRQLKELVLESVRRSGAGCPPFVIGVGLGGPYDAASRMAREATLRPLTQRNPDPEVAALEEELLKAVNDLGIGPMNLGGDTTALAVNVEIGYAHNGCNPASVRVECWCTRRATVRVHSDGRVEWLEGKK